MTEESVFEAARAIPDPADRARFLDRTCPDPAARREVEALLAAHDASNPLDRPPADLAKTGAFVPSEPAGQPGSIIAGRFKLLECIGEGGMGEVWVADQLEPVKRRVALKVIKAGMDSRSVLARFEAERQALALMDHPNIAKVLDAGTTPEGRPYFAMELVKGTPITEFCDARKLSPRERLELFVPVCQAIQHAHTKGIIHRDIKPSNVLVALHDEKPVPKVIDFGVAKAVGQQLTEKTLYTGFGALVGTPVYMAPEQATFNQLDIDTRADVYALGVLLYELLAGSPPVEPERLKKAALDEVLRLVREEEPPRPSQRLSTSQARASIAAVRQTDPGRLSKLMRGELDWIVMKALEKDRNRRYETATGLAADVQRHLAGEPVLAHPPTLGYRVRKAYRRNRAAVLVGGAFAGLLIAAAAVSSWLAVKAHRAEAAAEEKRTEAETNAKTAEENLGYAVNASFQTLSALANSEIDGLRLQVDLDLADLSANPRPALLRLARPMKTDTEPVDSPFAGPDAKGSMKFSNFPHYKSLREFVTAAALATGQNYAPLLPPITHDGRPVVSTQLSMDNRGLLTLGEDHTARLWDAATGRPIAVLRQGDERVIDCGFSSDDRTIFTDDDTDTARFWEAPTGTFRARTDPRPYPIPRAGSIDRQPSGPAGRDRLLKTLIVVGEYERGDWGAPVYYTISPVELWDMTTGRFVARLNGPGRDAPTARLVGDGRWVTMMEGDALLVFSAADGRLLTQLRPGPGERVLAHDVSPSGRRLVTVCVKRADPNYAMSLGDSLSFRVWDTLTWKLESTIRRQGPAQMTSIETRYWMDDAFGGGESAIAHTTAAGFEVYRAGRDAPVAEFPGASANSDFLGRVGDRVHGGNGWVCDARTFSRLLPPSGRRFHPDLAKFAPDGRFVPAAVNGQAVLIDTRTEKQFTGGWYHLPGAGWVSVEPGASAKLRLLPAADRLDLPADLLELWAQVAVRGELGPDGRFVKWDEATWQGKRRELAAKPAPRPDFPFPGHVAKDELHWLRAEFGEAKTDADKLRLARELLRRAEAIGDKAEAVRWRAEIAKQSPPVAPPPREVKP